jgi:ribosomal protein S18 acetylase RimI-like enzyme
VSAPVRIRRATQDDAEAILAVKRALALPPDAREAPGGGFLLGASLEGYRALIDAADVWVLTGTDGGVAGFAVLMPEPVLRASELWARRDSIRWDVPAGWSPPEHGVCYFDQLAILPSARMRAPELALTALRGAVRAGHQHLFATVVTAPVQNTASLALLRALGARRVGSVDEEYEGVGHIVSDLYYAPIDGADERLEETRAGRRAVR